MRILVYPHSMEIGGSQLNAIDLADAVARRGHEVVVFGEHGELDDMVASRGLEHVVADRYRMRPSPSVMRGLVATVRRRGVDLVHAYEWPPAVEAVYGPWLWAGTPVMATIMSMSVAPFIPSHLQLTVGTQAIAADQAWRRPPVQLLEPPVDTASNAPGDRLQHRPALSLGPDDFVVSVVSRLAPQLKREGILAAVRATALLARDLPIRLLVAGDGPCRDEVESAARAANATAGRDAVTVLGAVADPRPVYQSSDVILGMGGSALRAMAFARPLVVQGEFGFWQLLTPGSLPRFLGEGWYGVGDGTDGEPRLRAILVELHARPQLRAQCSSLSREVVVDRYSLDVAAARLEALYRDVVATSPSRRAAGHLLVPLAQTLAHDARRKVARRRGRLVPDDFNAQPHQSVERMSA